MPELPETEIIVRELRSACLGACIQRIEILNSEIMGPGTDLNPTWYENARIRAIQRHGKLILIQLSKRTETAILAIRLGMTGQFLQLSPDTAPAKHTHVLIDLADRAFRLHYRDPRRFGKVFLLRSAETILRGEDPLAIGLDGWIEMMAGRKGRIKAVLMNQKFLAGIGNIYANEILFGARLHPHTRTDRLKRAQLGLLLREVRKVLRQGIADGGTTIRDFRSLSGKTGRFQHRLRVYGRSGCRCPRLRCSGTIRLIRPTPLGQPSFYCPRCQPIR